MTEENVKNPNLSSLHSKRMNSRSLHLTKKQNTRGNPKYFLQRVIGRYWIHHYPGDWKFQIKSWEEWYEIIKKNLYIFHWGAPCKRLNNCLYVSKFTYYHCSFQHLQITWKSPFMGNNYLLLFGNKKKTRITWLRIKLAPFNLVTIWFLKSVIITIWIIVIPNSNVTDKICQIHQSTKWATTVTHQFLRK